MRNWHHSNIADREEFKLRFAEERKEWQSTKRWLYLNFGGVAALSGHCGVGTYERQPAEVELKYLTVMEKGL